MPPRDKDEPNMHGEKVNLGHYAKPNWRFNKRLIHSFPTL